MQNQWTPMKPRYEDTFNSNWINRVQTCIMRRGRVLRAQYCIQTEHHSTQSWSKATSASCDTGLAWTSTWSSWKQCAQWDSQPRFFQLVRYTVHRFYMQNVRQMHPGWAPHEEGAPGQPALAGLYLELGLSCQPSELWWLTDHGQVHPERDELSLVRVIVCVRSSC